MPIITLSSITPSIFIFLILFFISRPSLAQDFYEFDYRVTDGDHFSRVLKRFVKKNVHIRREDKGVTKTFLENKEVINWKELQPNTIIRIYIVRGKGNKEAIHAYTNRVNKKSSEKFLAISEVKEQKERAPFQTMTTKKNKAFRLKAFYHISTGNYYELLKDQFEAEYHQNTPLSVGIKGSYNEENSSYALDSRLYFSQISAATIEGVSSGEVDLPLELGINAYYRYIPIKHQLQPFFGFDFDKFSIFNLTQFAAGSSQLEAIDHSFTYLTLGASFAKKIKYPLKIRASFSQKILHHAETSSYNGQKYLIQFTIKAHERISYNLLLKQIILSGVTEVKTQRIGIGVDYTIF
jgi:hypothetical protein